ncbi:hypothetical protein GCM10007913_32870 [Devosia yakushimensis]|uniref:SMP-30/Gluconolactonase/LRE-like region domain-containing protein n=1 Tax=Devosia yakushimensis TaxID=470028 RepID=A0ABQ5UGY2_9HYPH|nr:SMP-30/gluconolactonase/LRE family protein [Devosia yakushimensis]GLQ11355.1 hypothetical protein GCM10007913_32870 [Devosia yakushimensis]
MSGEGNQALAISPVTFLVEERFGVGESPVWEQEHGRLWWCDIEAGAIHALTLADGSRQRLQFDEPVASLGLAGPGQLVVAFRRTVELVDMADGARRLVASVEHAKPAMRFNDGKVGPDGAFYVGSMDNGGVGSPAGCLYRVTAAGAVSTLVTGLVISNGLAWNGAATRLYHSDSRGEMWVDAWDFDRTSGAIANRRRLRHQDEANGRADGAACDIEGYYWSAGPSRSRINRFAPDGTLTGWVDLPLAHPTMPCFGGADMRTVFVTSLNSGAAGEGRDGVVQFRVAAPGVKVGRFGVPQE